MAERGKTEKSQHNEAGAPSAEVAEILSGIRDAFEGSGPVTVRIHSAGADPSDVRIDVTFVPSEVKVGASKHWAEATSPVASGLEDVGPVDKDDAYYGAVRQAIGRGTASVLLGTSTRSLEKNLVRAMPEYHSKSKIDGPRSKRWIYLPLIVGGSALACASIIAGTSAHQQFNPWWGAAGLVGAAIAFLGLILQYLERHAYKRDRTAEAAKVADELGEGVPKPRSRRTTKTKKD
jgi:hypothetical protein